MEVQKLQECHSGYPDWTTYTVRDEHNHCVAVVGDVDRAVAPRAERYAKLFAASEELLSACKIVLTRQDWPVGTMKIKAQLQAAVSKAEAT